MSIRPLPPDVVAQIKSSTTITSLNGVVCELMKNSLDAGSTRVDINVDYARGGGVVEDDGWGILPSEFRESGGLGKPHHTSKLNCQDPLHGHRGAFLASVSAMALLTITSHHHQHRSHNTLSMHKSKIITRQTPAPAQQHLSYLSHGTRVTVRDLFGNMPVRVKQRAIISEKQGGSAKEWEELKHHVVLLVLSWPGNVSVTLRDAETHQKMVIRAPPKSSEPSDLRIDKSAICSMLSQAAFIAPDDKSSWVSICASTPKWDISGMISLKPSATKHMQYLSLGIHPLLATDGQNMIQEEINRLFLNSDFGNDEEAEGLSEAERNRRVRDPRYKGGGFASRELRGGRKGVNRWPMFYINIQQIHSKCLDIDDVLEDKGGHVSLILELLQAMILAFLTKHHFRPKAARGQQLRQTNDDNEDRNEQRNAYSSKFRSKNTPLIAFQDLKTSGRPPEILRVADSGLRRTANRASAIDLLGADVKLPSFRQTSSRIEAPFDAWSRIKSGTRRLGPESLQEDEVLFNPAHVGRPLSAPPSLCSLSLTMQNKSSNPSLMRRPTMPLLSKSGKLIRRPFEEVLTQKHSSQPHTPQNEQRVDRGFEDGDDMTVWVNPVTKIRSIVNSRTGFTARENKAKLGNATVSQSHLISLQSFNTNLLHIDDNPSPWLSNILRNWDNPIFEPTETSIPQVSFAGAGDQTKGILHGRHNHCSQIDIDRAFKESSADINGRISKDALRKAEVISQVDKKFILVKADCMSTLPMENSMSSSSKMLVVIDQHAADERIRIESLMEELCTSSINTESSILTTRLDKSLTFEVSFKEISLLRTHKQHFANWGILYEIPNNSIIETPDTNGKITSSHRLVVQSLPPGILERCKLDPRLLIELIRTEAWKVHESNPHTLTAPSGADLRHLTWIERIHNCPQGIIDMLNSRACRSAIMFNDELSRSQCDVLVKKLAECKFPFQCAHGRPSLVPLVDLGHMPRISSGVEIQRGGEENFGFRLRKWKEEARAI